MIFTCCVFNSYVITISYIGTLFIVYLCKRLSKEWKEMNLFSGIAISSVSG